MRYAGYVNVRAIEAGFLWAKKGVTLSKVDQVIEAAIINGGCEPAFKGYRGYPATACLSVNDVAVHGVPNNYVLRPGDIITIDVGTRYKGMCVDAARTQVLEGVVNDILLKRTALKVAAEEVLQAELSVIKDGVTLFDIADAGDKEARRQGVNLMVQWGGHRIGETIHIDPFIPNGFDRSKGLLGVSLEKRRFRQTKLYAGDTICLEPVVTYGSTDIVIDKDGWTVRSKDGSDVAHTERCLLITENGYELLS